MHKYIIKKSLIAAGLLLVPLSVNAAGLGKLTVTSALGQPLRAEAELLADKKDDLATFVARLASQDAYREAKVDRALVLSNLKFNVEKKPNGQTFLKITSVQAVNEPFLELLIELNWSAGRLLREYSILLDPPGYSETQPIAPVSLPIAKALPVTAPSPVSAPAAAPAPAPAKMVPVEVATKAVEATKEESKPIAKSATKVVAEAEPSKNIAVDTKNKERKTICCSGQKITNRASIS